MNMDYTLVRSRRKTLAIEVTREAQIVVRAPQRCPQRQIDAFVESILTGKPSIADAAECIKAMRVIFAAVQSAEEGVTVSVQHE